METKTKSKRTARRKAAPVRKVASKNTAASKRKPAAKKSSSAAARKTGPKKSAAEPKPVPVAAKKTITKSGPAAKAKVVAAPVRIPITNIYDGNDYSAQIFVGSQKTVANVILDTGSSTLAVAPNTYSGQGDKDLTPTTLAQLVEYGTGGWAGPVVNTSLSIGLPGSMVSIQNVPIAITEVQQPGNFVGVDGILGLAYNALNDAYDFKKYFIKHGVNPPYTYPWSFPTHSFKKFTVQFNELIKSQKIPDINIDPYFSVLEEKGIVANKFAFYTRRSCANLGSGDKASPSDPLNTGFFILGGGEEQNDLFTGNFVTVQVLHDVYYNTNLKSVQVSGCDPVPALPLQSKYVPYMVSNSIIDSGTSYLALSGDVFNAIMQSFQKVNPAFVTLVNEAIAASDGMDQSKINLGDWPDVSFILSGVNGEDIKLTCVPSTYWQFNYPHVGKAMFQMGGPGQGEDQNQSILGLPLMNNYYCVFDRSLDTNGVIKFAAIK